MQVEIYSDVVCPWCAIGKARFEAALATFAAEGGGPVEVTWRPFQLDPTAPSTPSPVLDGYAKKFGGSERAREITEHVTEVAATVGWEFNFGIAQRANTFDAHRLLGFALHKAGRFVQGEVKVALLRAYFTEGRNIGDRAELVVIALACGLYGVAVSEMLASNAFVAETNTELNTGIERGITAVPSFVFDGQGMLSGAYEPEHLVRILHRIAARGVAE